MNYNTAIFYDIENLVKGYGNPTNAMASVSLKTIVNQVKNISQVEAIAVQRAYANWSDPRLGVMKGEINQLGIDPIQVFDFSRFQKKNAADIQLVIDVIDLVYIRPTIDTFVIISGDGGFSSLVRKLHEYGKFVICCAFSSSSNKILESICDRFITIQEPEEILVSKLSTNHRPSQLTIDLKITNPKVLRLSNSLPRLKELNYADVWQQSKRIIQWFIQDGESYRELSNTGINLSIIREAFKYAIDNFNPNLLGFAKFVDYLRFICSDTPVCLWTSDKFEVKVSLRNSALGGYIPLCDLDQQYLHSLEHYASIIVHGQPSLKLVKFDILEQVSAELIKLQPIDRDWDNLTKDLQDLLPNINIEDITATLINCSNTGIIHRFPTTAMLVEQKCSLDAEYAETAEISHKIKETMINKLRQVLGDNLQLDLFAELMNN